MRLSYLCNMRVGCTLFLILKCPVIRVDSTYCIFSLCELRFVSDFRYTISLLHIFVSFIRVGLCEQACRCVHGWNDKILPIVHPINVYMLK